MYKELPLFFFVCFISVIFFGCAKPLEQHPQSTLTLSNDLFSSSQKELLERNYEKAYCDYFEAISVDSSLSNISLLSNILYSWVISQSDPEDIPLLNAQKQVMLNPQSFTSRQEILSLARNDKSDIIHAFGLGISPPNVSNDIQKRLLARESALTDSYAWVARLACWNINGVKGLLDVSQKVAGVEIIKEIWFSEVIYIVKIKAPIKQDISKD